MKDANTFNKNTGSLNMQGAGDRSQTSGTTQGKPGLAKKVGDAIEKLGDKVEHSGMKKVGDVIEKLGDKIEHMGDSKKSSKT